MLGLDEIIFVSDPARALGDETGIFNVATPAGDSFRVTCRHGHPIVVHNFDPSPWAKTSALVWYVKKIREIADGSCFINGCVRRARK